MSEVQLQFQTPPSVWSIYAKLLVAQKSAVVPDGGVVPRLEATLSDVTVDAARLASYREVCGDRCTEYLPIAYPHVLASGMQLAMLSVPQFPVRLLGLVHVRNLIEQRRPLLSSETGALHCHLSGHRDTIVGQEFDLNTQWIAQDGSVPWIEVCTFLARKRTAGANRPRAAAAAAMDEVPRVETVSFAAPAGLGRRYGRIAGDLNPIHLSDLSAKLFGFKAAIAHGMWSLARCAAELDAGMLAGACSLDVSFKLPVFLPSWLMLEKRIGADATQFVLYDAQGEKPHLTGRLARLA